MKEVSRITLTLAGPLVRYKPGPKPRGLKRHRVTPAKAAAFKRYRARHPELMREHRAIYYERHRAMILFKQQLTRLLEDVRRAEIARGKVPYDG